MSAVMQKTKLSTTGQDTGTYATILEKETTMSVAEAGASNETVSAYNLRSDEDSPRDEKVSSLAVSKGRTTTEETSKKS